MYGDVVCGVDHEQFEHAFDKIKTKYKVKNDTDVPVEGMIQLCDEYKKVFQKHFGKPFPQDPLKQLELAIEAVFKSWMQPRAVKYRQVENITGPVGHGGERASRWCSATWATTRARASLSRATRPPARTSSTASSSSTPRARTSWPASARRCPSPKCPSGTRQVYKRAARDQGQARGPLPRRAGHRVHDRARHAVHAADAQRQAHRRRGGEDRLRHGEGKADRRKDGRAAHSGRRPHAAACCPASRPRAKQPAKKEGRLLTIGLPASPGAAVGKLAFTAAEAVDRTLDGEKVLLVRKETNPEDIEGMHSAVGILTSTGGMTSHAAVVARGWGRCCVAGAGEITIDEKARKIKVGGKTFTATTTRSRSMAPRAKSWPARSPRKRRSSPATSRR